MLAERGRRRSADRQCSSSTWALPPPILTAYRMAEDPYLRQCHCMDGFAVGVVMPLELHDVTRVLSRLAVFVVDVGYDGRQPAPTNDGSTPTTN
jgi:hypothetical protein